VHDRAVIEWLGVGVREGNQRWIIRGVSSRLDVPELTAVVSADAAARRAMLDAASGRVVAQEGRVWVGGVPVMADTQRRIQSLLANIVLADETLARRSRPPHARGGRWERFWRVVRGRAAREHEAVLRMLRHVGLDARLGDIGRDDADEGAAVRAKARLARAVVPRPDHVLVRDVDSALADGDAAEFLAALRRIVRAERMAAVFTCRSLALAHAHADRLIVLADARVIVDGVPRAADEHDDRDRATAPLAGVR
jgi:ABC-type phosphate/phosphonate transport system ATPase subunit